MVLTLGARALQRSRGHEEKLRPGTTWQGLESLTRGQETTGEGAASVSVETPAHWKCKDIGLATEDSGRCGVELA